MIPSPVAAGGLARVASPLAKPHGVSQKGATARCSRHCRWGAGGLSRRTVSDWSTFSAVSVTTAEGGDGLVFPLALIAERATAPGAAAIWPAAPPGAGGGGGGDPSGPHLRWADRSRYRPSCWRRSRCIIHGIRRRLLRMNTGSTPTTWSRRSTGVHAVAPTTSPFRAAAGGGWRPGESGGRPRPAQPRGPAATAPGRRLRRRPGKHAFRGDTNNLVSSGGFRSARRPLGAALVFAQGCRGPIPRCRSVDQNGPSATSDRASRYPRNPVLMFGF